MAPGNLYEFSGPDLVKEIHFSKPMGANHLTITFACSEGERRLFFENPRPLDDVFPIVSAEQVWIHAESPGGPAQQVVVEYWVKGFCQFVADSVVDADIASYDTRPDTPVALLLAGDDED